MVQSRLPNYAELLRETVEVFDVLTEPALMPASASLAARELATSRDQPAVEGLWGEDPVRSAYALALMSYKAALEQGRAMAALMTGDHTILPVAALLRALVEVGSQTWWLLEPEIGAVARVARMQTVRYRSAAEGERAATAMEVAPEERHLYTETVQQVVSYSQKLGLASPTKEKYVYVCGDQRLETPRYRVSQMFSDIDVPGVYSLYSGFAHGELFSLWQAFQAGARIDGHLHYYPAISEDTFAGAAAVATWAIYAAAARGVNLFGLDSTDLDTWIDKHDAVLHPSD